MEESPETIHAAMCGVSKHHQNRSFKHQYIKILNMNEQQHLDIREKYSKSVSSHTADSELPYRCSEELKSGISSLERPEKYCRRNTALSNYRMINKDELKIPINFEPKKNVDKNDPVELLEAMYISDDQGYNVYFSLLAAFSRTGIPFDMF